MNDRIRELAEQAGLSHMPSNYPDMADLYKGADFELEKFAELIVRECMGLVDGYTYPVQTQSHTIYHIASETIKEHFGVEE